MDLLLLCDGWINAVHALDFAMRGGFRLVRYSQQAALHLQIASDARLQLSSPLCVVENSVLRTAPGGPDQVGHFDLDVHSYPSGDCRPFAAILITPIDHDSSLRLIPIGLVDGIPTHDQFEQISKRVTVPKGCTLIMRCDIAHSGTSSPGKRLHTIVGPQGTTSLGMTYFLPHND